MEKGFTVNSIENWLLNMGLPDDYAVPIRAVILVVIIIIAAFVANFVTRKLLLAYIRRLIRKSKSFFDDILLGHKLLDRLANYAPVLIIYYTIPSALAGFPSIIGPVQVLISTVMIILAVLVADALLNVLHAIYNTFPISRDVNIRGYIQIAKILAYLIGFILFLSAILGKSPLVFLTGLGALAAVLLLVFKDTILGFVASIQLSANDMVRIGDWIEMPGHNADGTVYRDKPEYRQGK
jgi:miniconductance mechanosensitive channel